MKKIWILVTSLLLSISLIGCLGCGEKKPSKKATVNNRGGYGMQYHIVLHIPSILQSHSSPCTKYEIIDVHMYMDKLGILSGNEIVWKNFDFDEFPFEENGQNIDSIRVNVQSNTIQLSGFNNPYNHFNGKYMIE